MNINQRRYKMKLKVLSGIKLAVVFLSLLIIVSVGEVTAQINSIRDITDNKYALENLLDGINSDNEGVKRSSIYLAGKYRIAEAERVLIAQLKREQNPGNRILIALVLYKLKSEKGLSVVRKLALHDNNQNVRRMSTHIYNEYITNDSNNNSSWAN